MIPLLLAVRELFMHACRYRALPGASKWPMSPNVPLTFLTPMRLPDYHEIMARKSSQQRLKAPLGRGRQWLEVTLILPSASAEYLGETLVALGSPGVVQENVQHSGETVVEPGMDMAKVIAAFPMEQTGERLLGEVRRILDALG